MFRGILLSQRLRSERLVVSREGISTGAASTMTSSSSSPKDFSIGYITIGKAEEAQKLAQVLLDARLIACANLVPQVTSMYRWEGKLTTDSEVLMMVKTRTTLVNKLIDTVKKNHPYQVPEVITVPLENGNPAYLDWLAENLPEH